MANRSKPPSGARADCVSDTLAIEFYPTDNWAEAIGKSLHYAEQTGKSATMFLYCKRKFNPFRCLGHQLRLDSTIAAFDLPTAVRLFEEGEVVVDGVCR